MKPIRMVDLKGQYDAIKSKINSSIQNVINSSAFINGEDVKEFRTELAKYLGVKHVITCGNGTDALQASLMVLDLNRGDEVITPSFTFGATVEVIVLLGLKPVFVDIDPDSYNMDVTQIENVITKKTRVILPVHLYGQCANMGEILKISRKYNLYVIEDNAQAIGADYYLNGNTYKAGVLGNIGCTSFFPSKNLGCYGDGGAIYTDDNILAEKLYAVINHGMKTKYKYDYIGINSRLDSIQAAILRVKLKYLDKYIKKRIAVADYYDKAFSKYPRIKIPRRVKYSNHVFHQYTISLTETDRDDLKNKLLERGIPTMIYYPAPMHLQNAYQMFGYKQGSLPVTEKLCKTVLSLPMHTELEKDQLKYITETIITLINK